MLQFKEFLAVLPLIAILGCILFYTFSSYKLFYYVIDKLKYCTYLFFSFVLILISCLVFLAIYYMFLNEFSKSLLSNSILQQIFVLLLAMIILLLIEVGFDYFIINLFLGHKLIARKDMEIINNQAGKPTGLTVGDELPLLSVPEALMCFML